ncbi:hypothetical protein CC86DRAFT_247104, partial [Ophiobolus disseminans]
CGACLDDKPTSVTMELACNPEHHTYCHTCIETLFHDSLHKDTALFPPRCCKEPIPPEACRPFLSRMLIQEAEAKQAEIETANAVYCSAARCSSLIPSNNIKAGTGTCVACKQQTCATCKNAKHEGSCPEDVNDMFVKGIADRAGWQQCSKCKRFIQFNIGCFHIICICGFEFCYMCGTQWKTCKCPQFDEGHL